MTYSQVNIVSAKNVNLELNEVITHSKMFSDPAEPESSHQRASIFKQTYLLVWRAIITNYRDPKLLIARIFQTVILGLVLSAIYFRRPAAPYIGLQFKNESGYSEHSDIRQINGAIFSATAVASFNFLFYVILIFPLITPIWRVEYEDELYSLPLAFLAVNLAEVVLLLLLPIIFLSTIYFLMGFYPGSKQFFTAYAIFTVMSNTAGSFGYFGSSLSDNPQIVTELVPALMLPMICFGGFVTPSNTIPGVISWLKYFSWFPYSTEALSINQWENVKFDCLVEDQQLSYENCPDELRMTGVELLKSLEFEVDNLGTDFWIMIVLEIEGFG